MNYDTIKTIAGESGLKVDDLLAMSPKNDPFYAGTGRDVEMAEWFHDEVWLPAGYTEGVHLRRAHYWAVSRPHLRLPRPIKQGDSQTDRYLNTVEAWGYLVQAAKMARYLGLIDLSQIVDRKNPDPIVHVSYYDGSYARWGLVVDDVDEPWLNIYAQQWVDLQPALLEIWCEKTTMNDVLEPLCKQWGMNLVTFAGEASITAVNDLADRIEVAGKPTRIFYISDFDPAGNSMSKAVARKLEWILMQRGVNIDVKLRSLVLTPDQVKQYKLPRTPIKATERRAGSFEEAFGAGGVELDALEATHPGELARIVRRAASPYIKSGAQDIVSDMRSQIKARVMVEVKAITSQYQEHIDALRQMTKELRALDPADVDVSDIWTEPFEFDVAEDDEEWLFSSWRSYESQIAHYKQHAGQDSVFSTEE